MDRERMRAFIEERWEREIIPALVEYIKIPNKSPHFDKEWEAHGEMDRAVELIRQWCAGHALPGMKLEVVRLPGRTPLIFMEIPGASEETVLLYGHLDKQPEMTGWDPELGPWKPVLRGERLYGRGGADDGYAAFASLTALAALAEQKIPHARAVILIEACEESGSEDLPAYIDLLADQIGTPSLVVCLDSGCGNYEQLWCTTSLRGIVMGSLRVEILREGVHSGDASGIVPSSFRIARQLLSRLEDETTGEIQVAACHVEVPPERLAQARKAAAVLGETAWNKFPFVEGGRPVAEEPVELVLNRTWRPTLSVVGAEGLPPLENAGNVLRPSTTLMLSLRIPPTCDGKGAAEAIEKTLLSDPPYGARVSFEAEHFGGWNAPPFAPWLEAAIDRASRDHFGKEALYMGEGGSIPFMGMLGEKFPEAQFMITGLLGPGSNAHGPNEFLHIPTGKRLTACVAQVIAEHFRRAK